MAANMKRVMARAEAHQNYLGSFVNLLELVASATGMYWEAG